jgi:hypothetical protein
MSTVADLVWTPVNPEPGTQWTPFVLWFLAFGFIDTHGRWDDNAPWVA